MVGKSAGAILNRLWNKVHELLRRCIL